MSISLPAFYKKSGLIAKEVGLDAHNRTQCGYLGFIMCVIEAKVKCKLDGKIDVLSSGCKLSNKPVLLDNESLSGILGVFDKITYMYFIITKFLDLLTENEKVIFIQIIATYINLSRYQDFKNYLISEKIILQVDQNSVLFRLVSCILKENDTPIFIKFIENELKARGVKNEVITDRKIEEFTFKFREMIYQLLSKWFEPSKSFM